MQIIAFDPHESMSTVPTPITGRITSPRTNQVEACGIGPSQWNPEGVHNGKGGWTVYETRSDEFCIAKNATTSNENGR
jgi:hypothetical protein